MLILSDKGTPPLGGVEQKYEHHKACQRTTW